MISVLRRDEYRLIETKGQTKILILENIETFAWINVGEIGEILVTTHKMHSDDYILAIGNYRLYDVLYDNKFTNGLHLELYVGEGIWQGYILPTGLPTD